MQNFNNSGNANWQVKGNFFYNTATGNAVAANNTTAELQNILNLLMVH
ncbi:MAG: hypothetical protein WDM90_19920 [Ferruginibacter sp.]